MRRILLSFIFIFSILAATAATFTANSGSGNWNNSATWSPAGIPAAGDSVVIPSGAEVVLNVSATIADLNVQSGGAVMWNSSAVLTITSSIWTAGSGAGLNANGCLDFSNTGGQTPVIFSGGDYLVSGTIASSTAPFPTIEVTSTSAGYLSGNATNVDLNLHILGTLDVASNFDINGELNVDGGTFILNPLLGGVVRNLVLQNGASFSADGFFFDISGVEDTSTISMRVIGTGNTLTMNSTLFFNGTGSQSILIDGAGTFDISPTTFSLSCPSLTIRSEGDSIRSLSEITLNSTSTLNTNGKLIIGSEAGNQGVIDISSGTINGTITIERYLVNTSLGAWRHFGFPFPTGTLGDINGLSTVSNPQPSQVNAFSYDASRVNAGVNDSAVGWLGATDWSAASLDKAYIIWSNPDQTHPVTRNPIQASGTVNTTSKTYNLSYSWDPDTSSVTNSGRGWNFVPNPFPSNIALDLLIGDASFDPTYKGVHMFNVNSQQYIAYTQGGGPSDTGSATNSNSVPITGGFWVKANTTGQSITVDPSMLTSANGVSIHRIAGTEDVLRLYLKDNQGRMDVIKILIDQNGTAGMDLGLDAFKIFSMNKNYPGLFMEYGLDRMSINAIPYSMTHQSVNIGLKKGASSQYSIEALTKDFNPGTQVILEDKDLNVFHDLRTGPYSFAHLNSGLDSRFVLHLNDVSMGMEEWKDEKMFISGNGSRTEFRFSENETLEWIEVVDITGALLHRFTNVSGGVLDLTQFDSPGIELLRIRTSTGERVLKF